MLAISVPAPVQGKHGMMSDHLREERLILVPIGDCFLEIADALDHAPPDQQIGRVRDRGGCWAKKRLEGGSAVAMVPPAWMPSGSTWSCLASSRSPVQPYHQHDTPVDHADFRERGEGFRLLPQLAGSPHIVRVEKRDIVALGPGDAHVARCGRTAGAAIRMAEEHDLAGSFPRMTLREFWALVGRAVVDQQKLPVDTGLRDDALDRLTRKRSAFRNGTTTETSPALTVRRHPGEQQVHARAARRRRCGRAVRPPAERRRELFDHELPGLSPHEALPSRYACSQRRNGSREASSRPSRSAVRQQESGCCR